MNTTQLLRKAVEAKKEYGEKAFNCWGLTAYLIGWIERPIWLRDHEMECLLKMCELPDDIEIFVFYCHGELVHTAVKLDGEKILHKDGSCKIRIDPLSDVKTWHRGMYGEQVISMSN